MNAFRTASYKGQLRFLIKGQAGPDGNCGR